jgi:hypothetical protein
MRSASTASALIEGTCFSRASASVLAGRPGVISAILALTRLMTSSGFSPKRVTTPPPTASAPALSKAPRRSAGPNSTEASCASVTGNPLARSHDGFAQVVEALDEAKATNDVFDAVDRDRASTDIEIAAFHGGKYIGQGEPVGPQGVGIDINLILANETADGGDFGHAFDSLQRVAHIPVLHAAQLLRIPAAGRCRGRGCGRYRSVDPVPPVPTQRLSPFAPRRPRPALPFHDLPPFQRIPQHLPQRGGIGTKLGLHSGRQQTGRQAVEFFEDAAARPIELRLFPENDVDRGKPKHRVAAHRTEGSFFSAAIIALDR